MRWISALFLVMVMICGCAARQENSGEAASSGAQAAGMTEKNDILPLNIAIRQNNADADDVYAFEITVRRENEILAVPTLEIIPGENTALVDTPASQTLDDLTTAPQIVRTIRVTGTTPSFTASVRMTGSGFGFETHQTWPEVAKTQAMPVDDRVELPAPIVVGGQTITRGVEVKP